MAKGIRQLLRNADIRRYACVAAYVLLGMSVGAFLTSQYRMFEYQNQAVGPLSVGSTSPFMKTVYTLPRALPVALSIPTLHISTTFEEPLGLNADQTVGVPHSYDNVGWYKYSPTPGELGPSIVLGHVDSYQGPAVFFHLGQLKVGDSINITRDDGSVATFHVTGLKRYGQSEFPTDLVYGDIDYAGLRLITCSGVYDHGVQRYSHNLVVYAALDDPEDVTSTEPDGVLEE